MIDEVELVEASRKILGSAARVGEVPVQMGAMGDDRSDCGEEGVLVDAVVLRGATDENESALLLGWSIDRDEIEHSFGGDDVVGGWIGKIVFGDETKIEKRGGDGGFHDHHGRSLEAAGGGEEGEMGSVAGSNDEGGALAHLSEATHGGREIENTKRGEGLQISDEGERLVFVTSLAVRDAPDQG